MKKALLLTDGKAGHENQSRALVRALGCEPVVVETRFRSRACKALSYLLDGLGVKSRSLFGTLPADLPGDVVAVVGTGSGTFYPAKVLAAALGVKCAVVLYPRGYRLSGFDCIVAPAFDLPRKAPNVVEVPANLVAADAQFYARGVEEFSAHYARTCGRPLDVSAPAAAVVVGGPNKCSTMTPQWIKARLDAVFAENGGSEMWVTTSRRTPPDVEAVVDSYPWSYKLVYSRDRFNPIPGFVSLAKRLYVTAESTGMLSEACTSGEAEVVPLDNLLPGRHKFRRFLEAMTAQGYANGRRKIDLSGQFASARRLMGL